MSEQHPRQRAPGVDRPHGRPQTRLEERFNAVTHAVLAGFLLFAMPPALVRVYHRAVVEPTGRTLAVLVYMICILTMLGSSTAYHALPATSRYKRTLNRIDHISIFLAIAGSYTPFALATLDRPQAMRVLALEWGLAVVGIVYKLSWFRKSLASTVFSIALYLAMGWLIVLYGPQVAANASPAQMASIAVGGLAYTAGVVFYSIQKPHMHNIWHICVDIGVVAHFLGIVLFI